MFNSRQLELIEKSLSANLLRIKDNDSLYKEVATIVDITKTNTAVAVHPSITIEQLEEVNSALERVEESYLAYVSLRGTGNLALYEEIKKDIVGELIHLSRYKDVFSFELEHLEERVKKEIFTRIATDIASRDNISFTQAEKKVVIEPSYIMLKNDIHALKQSIGVLKNKFDFYMKIISVITQTISVAGKELHNTNSSY